MDDTVIELVPATHSPGKARLHPRVPTIKDEAGLNTRVPPIAFEGWKVILADTLVDSICGEKAPDTLLKVDGTELETSTVLRF